MSDSEFLAAMQAKYPRYVKMGKVSCKVRLTGPALTALREYVWERDTGHCVHCKKPTYWNARFNGDPDAYEMDHIQTRGASGSDLPGNTRTLCGHCHRLRHSAVGIGAGQAGSHRAD